MTIRLQKHNEQISFLIAEKDTAVAKATTFFEKATLVATYILSAVHLKPWC